MNTSGRALYVPRSLDLNTAHDDQEGGAAMSDMSFDITDNHGHVPVLRDRMADLLAPGVEKLADAAVIVDGTLGAGGHTEHFLRTFPAAHVIGVDRDPASLADARERLAPFGERFVGVQFCGGCGACAEGCYSGAIEVIGREMTVEDVLADVVRDRPFYDGGGGVTISGGEPMMQFEFTRALLRAAREAGVHTCLDTCGFAPTGSFMELLDGVDLFLYDLKDTDPERHLQTTGGPLEPILANLAAIDAAGGRIILRCPLIPDVNDDEGHLRGIADVANSLKNVIAVDLHPYHPFGRSKVARLGACDPSAGINSADAKDVSRWLSVVEAATRVPVRAL